jgi:hypothetical protein
MTKLYKKMTEEELRQIPLEELADRVTPSWRIRPNVLELVRRVAEAEKDCEANDIVRKKYLAAIRKAEAERDRYLEQRRRLLVLAEYGYGMEFYAKYVDDPDWLTVEWLDRFYGEPQPDYVIAALENK